MREGEKWELGRVNMPFRHFTPYTLFFCVYDSSYSDARQVFVNHTKEHDETPTRHPNIQDGIGVFSTTLIGKRTTRRT